jgi:hypothetical protein
MSASALSLLVATLAGAGLGGLYLALLWAAVRRLPRERGGLAVFVGLRVARLVLLLGALAAAAALAVPAEGLIAALVGFVAVRFAATRLAGLGTSGSTAWK